MARFRLREKHYLLTDPPMEWEQKEISQTTGKSVRKVYIVPRYLDPDDPADHNYPREGLIIVSTKEDKNFPNDIVIKGKPTPDMEALDNEARDILSKMTFIHPIESLDSQGASYADKVIAELERQMDKVVTKKDEQIGDLQKQIAELTKLVNQSLQKKVA